MKKLTGWGKVQSKKGVVSTPFSKSEFEHSNIRGTNMEYGDYLKIIAQGHRKATLKKHIRAKTSNQFGKPLSMNDIMKM